MIEKIKKVWFGAQDTVIGLFGYSALSYGFYLAYQERFTSATFFFGTGLLLIIFSNHKKFESFKGFGIEARTRKSDGRLDEDQTPALPMAKIQIGHDGPYVALKNNIYNVSKVVSIGIKNVGGSYLSNCKVSCSAMDKDSGKTEPWLLAGPFSLSIGEERYECVAAYNEPVPPHQEVPVGIRLCAPPSGNFWRPPTLPTTGGIVTITMVSAEAKPCEVLCRFWVVDGKFQWEVC